jgi:hypothetical protein
MRTVPTADNAKGHEYPLHKHKRESGLGSPGADWCDSRPCQKTAPCLWLTHPVCVLTLHPHAVHHRGGFCLRACICLRHAYSCCGWVLEQGPLLGF